MPEPLATTAHVLHPREAAELMDTKRQHEATLAGAGHGMTGGPLANVIRNQIQNPEAIVKQIKDIDATLAREGAQPIPATQLDEAVRLERDLRADWLHGMPSQEEYRRNTAGAVDKHRAWDRAKKTAVLKWKNLRRRLHASGISDSGLIDEADVSNVERFRPRGTSADLADAQIPQRRTIMQQPLGAAPVAVMSEEQREALAEHAPEILAKMALLSNEDRASILGMVDDLIASARPVVTPVEPAPRESAWNRMQKEAKALGINTFGMNAEQMRLAIAEKRAEAA